MISSHCFFVIGVHRSSIFNWQFEIAKLYWRLKKTTCSKCISGLIKLGFDGRIIPNDSNRRHFHCSKPENDLNGKPFRWECATHSSACVEIPEDDVLLSSFVTFMVVPYVVNEGSK